jgi:hypothetical protein
MNSEKLFIGAFYIGNTGFARSEQFLLGHGRQNFASALLVVILGPAFWVALAMVICAVTRGLSRAFD